MMDRIYLRDGRMIESEVNGRTLDGEQGHAIILPAGNWPLRELIAKAQEIEVERSSNGDYWIEKEKAE